MLVSYSGGLFPDVLCVYAQTLVPFASFISWTNWAVLSWQQHQYILIFVVRLGI